MDKNANMFTISHFSQLRLRLTVSPHVPKSYSVAALVAQMTDINDLSCYSHIAALPRDFPMAGATLCQSFWACCLSLSPTQSTVRQAMSHLLLQ